MRVSVDSDTCTGHTRCNLLCPEIYVLDDRGHCGVEDNTLVPPELEEKARRGAEACPEDAITLIEE